MKKNRMMRLASGLLVAVLITTSTISGTFAKYTTSDEALDSAKVAKWGVTVTTEGEDLFTNAYDGTVISTANDVVAPGTKNDTGVTFTITGTPEVSTAISVAFTAEKDVFLKAGSYADMTTGDTEDAFNFVGDAYRPVKFTLTKNGTPLVTDGSIAAIETALTISETADPNDDLSAVYGTYKLTWKWDFPTQPNPMTPEVKLINQQDTLLGDLAANPALTAKGDTAPFTALLVDDDFSTEIGFKISITVTQVD